MKIEPYLRFKDWLALAHCILGVSIFKTETCKNSGLKYRYLVEKSPRWKENTKTARRQDLNRDVTKSRLPANFTGQKRAYHQLKLLWKTKTWSNFKITVELKSCLDLSKSLPSYSLAIPLLKTKLLLYIPTPIINSVSISLP